MRRIALLLLVATVVGCGGSSDSTGPGTSSPRQATPLPAGAPTPVTAFAQTVADTAGIGEVFPCQANSWVLDRDLALAKGYGLQYSSALALFTGTPTAPSSHGTLLTDLMAGAFHPFPYDQDASEVVFLTPSFGAADGVKTAVSSDGSTIGVPALSGTRSGYLNGTSSSRLARTVPIAAGTSYTLSWKHEVLLVGGLLLGSDAAPYAPLFRVVLRNPATGAAIGDPLFATTATTSPATRSVSLPPGLPADVELSFELRSPAGSVAVVDDVILSDGGGPVASFANGDFEGATLSPWHANVAAESQNVRSGARDVGPDAGPKLRVTRTFYAPPAEPWARLVDVFENPGNAPVTTHAVYVTILGGPTPVAAIRTSGKSVVGWDADGLVRDVGLVAGSGTPATDAGSGYVFLVHPITVPAGGTIALVHFIVQLGAADGGATAADVPAGTDAAAAAIATGFRVNQAYVLDLESGVLPAIVNF